MIVRDAFDWWSGIWLPLIVGAGSLVLAGAALVISLFAWSDSRKAEKNSRRTDRAERVRELYIAAMDTATAIIDGNSAEAYGKARDLQSTFALSKIEGPRSIAAQLLYWCMYAEEADPDKARRWNIASDISTHVLSGITRYVEDDSGRWKLEMRTIKDLPK